MDVGVVGLGTEHLERTAENWDAVLGLAAEAGSTYVDLLYVEPDYWEAFGPVLRPFRDRLVLAAHWGAAWRYDLPYCHETFDAILGHLGNDHAEVALMTMVDDEKKWDEWAVPSVEHLQRYREQGRIGGIGMSGHILPVAMKAVRSGLIDVLMFPVNLLDHDDEAKQGLLRACAEEGVAVVAMKVYHGGRLFSANGRPTGITPAQCLDYVLSLPVATTVPGVKTAAEYRATLCYAAARVAERDHRPALAGLHDTLRGQCVYCHHCLPCPQGLEIGWLLYLLDQVQGAPTDDQRAWYNDYQAKASDCTECSLCLARCPFEVDILGKLKQAAALFE
jgi:hypothetical protein